MADTSAMAAAAKTQPEMPAFGLTQQQRMLRDTVRQLMERHAAPDHVRQLDLERTFPHELYAAWADAGLLQLPFPKEYGGIGGTPVDLMVVVEELARVSTDFCMAFVSPIFCGLNIGRKGSDEQKHYWLPRVMDGSVKMFIGTSEPDAGSDVGAMRTNARRADGRWISNGQKLWQTGAGLPDTVISLYAKTNPEVHYRVGISLFLVDNNAPGIELRKLDMLGRRCCGTYEVYFKDVEVPVDRIVGGENKGWDCMLSGLQLERAMAAVSSCGGAQAVVDLALQYSKERVQFDRPIGTFQAIAHMIADMQTEVEAARSFTWRVVSMIANKQDALREITMAKLFSSEVHAKVANLGVQIMGAFGLSEESDMQRYFSRFP